MIEQSERLLSVTEVSQRLGVSTKTVRAWCREGACRPSSWAGAGGSIPRAPVTWLAETRSAKGATRTVEGHAAVFGRPALIGGSFREQIAPGAFRKALRAGKDVPLVYGHDQDKLLASTKNGSLTITEDSRGLKIRATITGTSLGDDVVTLVREGLADRMSFAFSIADDGEEWRHGADGVPERTIREVAGLFDVSIVTTPAYDDAEVALAEARDAISARAARIAGTRPRVTSVRARSVYGPDARHSFWRDKVTVAAADEQNNRAAQSGVPWGVGGGGERGIPDPVHGGLKEARERLATVEARDSTTATGSLGNMLGASTGATPGFIADAYSLAVRSRAALASALPQADLPKGADKVRSMRLATGAGAAVQATQNTAPAEVDATSAIVESPIATIASMLDVSQQLIDFAPSGGELDLVLAQEMGRAMGGTLERQVFVGSGTSGEMRGFFALAGTTTVIATGATTFSTVWGGLMDARRQHQVAFGAPADLLVMHPRRQSMIDFAGTLAAPLSWGVDRRILSDEVPTDRWTGGTNDALLYLSTEEIALYSNPVSHMVSFDQAGSSNLTVRLVSYQFAALHPKQPLAVTHLGGTLSAPSFP